ncbi:hypothetical protein [Secundilactobacillus similis]|uniref:dUTPase n=1 Tax=Secundilactobacillus similis DSM 23365 = JCM 2765 TaxID=1423804 RepID=A0A0R2F3P9_9LACO|nr:hypothetical protein [Secundilactobacillus similis]KRN22910.1 hypothetical protein FD14_GL000748 [Secundilactobacillus similis DSM 23365 = JCM 2765]
MTLDLAKLLQSAIQYRTQFNYTHQVAIRPEEGLRVDYVALDIALGDLAKRVGWYRLGETPTPTDHDDLVAQYVTTMTAFFNVAARQTWSHLIVMNDDQLTALMAKRPAKSLSQQYLAIRHFVDQALFERQQTAFEHAWHLFLKWGLVDLKLTPAEIETVASASFQLTD